MEAHNRRRLFASPLMNGNSRQGFCSALANSQTRL